MPISNVGIVPAASPRGDALKVQLSAGQTQAKEPPQQEKKKTQPIVVQSTAANLQKYVFNRKLQFVVDHNSNQVIVKVIDKETDKVIKVLPPEELQRLHRNIRENIGFLFDERV